METIDNIQQYKIYADAIPSTAVTGVWNFTYDDGSTQTIPEHDFHLPVFLTRTYEIYEYVDVQRETEIKKIERQEFNPFFIEFGFFDDIQRNRVNRGGELTSAMINFIRLRRPDVASLDNNGIRKWFNEIGVNEFPWNKGTSQEVSEDDIDKVNFVAGHIVSKAKHFNIDVNK